MAASSSVKIGHLEAGTPIVPLLPRRSSKLTAVALYALLLGVDALAIKSVASAHDLSTRYVAKFLGLPVGEAHITGEITIRIVGKYQVVGFGGSYDGRVAGIVLDGVRMSPTDYQSSSTNRAPLSGQQARTISMVSHEANWCATRLHPPRTFG